MSAPDYFAGAVIYSGQNLTHRDPSISRQRRYGHGTYVFNIEREPLEACHGEGVSDLGKNPHTEHLPAFPCNTE